jgi:hypothetical protein
MVHEHEKVDLVDVRLRRGLADHLEEHVPASEPEPAGAADDGALDGAREPEHGALQRERAPGVIAGGEHERHGGQVPRAHLQARAEKNGLVPAEERGRAVRPRAQLVVHHPDAPERRVGAERGLQHGGRRGVRARVRLVHVEVDVREAVAVVCDGGGGRRHQRQEGEEEEGERQLGRGHGEGALFWVQDSMQEDHHGLHSTRHMPAAS